MKLFCKKKANSPIHSQELAGQIAVIIIRVQTGIAQYLNSRTRNWSKRVKLFVLILFCVLFAAINSYLIIYSIHQ